MDLNEKDSNSKDIRKRKIKRLKKLLLIAAALFLLIPTILCIILFVKVNSIEDKLEYLYLILPEGTASQEKMESETENIYNKEDKISVAANESYEVQSAEANAAADLNLLKKKAYLTFDDGPSINTDEILDILKDYHIKATFFVVGKEDETSKSIYRRIVEEGHTIGMHSYSHDYKEIYASLDAFRLDLEKIQKLISDTTGVKPKLYRFPGGSSNKVSETDMKILADYLTQQGITYVDWNVTSKDAGGDDIDADSIINNILYNIDNIDNPVILMHDAKNKESVIEALPAVITKLQEQDYTLDAIREDMDLVQHLSSQTE